MPPLWVLDTPWVALVRSHIWPVFDCRSRACLARCRPVRMPSPRDFGIDLLCSLRAFQRALACLKRRSIEGDMALGVWLARWLAHRRGPALLPASRTLREFICEFTRLRNATLARASPIRVTHILSQTARPPHSCQRLSLPSNRLWAHTTLHRRAISSIIDLPLSGSHGLSS